MSKSLVSNTSELMVLEFGAHKTAGFLRYLRHIQDLQDYSSRNNNSRLPIIPALQAATE